MTVRAASTLLAFALVLLLLVQPATAASSISPERVVVSGVEVPVGFQGDFWSGGGVWMGARWYRPSSGGFVARDSFAGVGSRPLSWNRYLYGDANPVSNWDPSGRSASGSQSWRDVIDPRWVAGVVRERSARVARERSLMSEGLLPASGARPVLSGAVPQWGAVKAPARNPVAQVAVVAASVAAGAVCAGLVSSVSGGSGALVAGAAASSCAGFVSRAGGVLAEGGSLGEAWDAGADPRLLVVDAAVGAVAAGVGGGVARSVPGVGVFGRAAAQGVAEVAGGGAAGFVGVYARTGSWGQAWDAATDVNAVALNFGVGFAVGAITHGRGGDRAVGDEPSGDAAESAIPGIEGRGGTRTPTNPATEAAETTRVGRWMGADEHAAMVNSGEVQVGSGGTTYVASPASAESYMSQAAPGSHYVEFDVPSSSLRPAGQPDWAQIPSSENTMWGKLAPQRGWPVPESPVSACNIVHVATKLSC